MASAKQVNLFRWKVQRRIPAAFSESDFNAEVDLWLHIRELPFVRIDL